MKRTKKHQRSDIRTRNNAKKILNRASSVSRTGHRAESITAKSGSEYKGVYRASPRPFGFVTISGESGKISDVIVYAENNSAGAITGDEVIVTIRRSGISKTGVEGIIKKVLKRTLTEPVCTIIKKDGMYYAITDKKSGSLEIKIAQGDMNGAAEGDIVKVVLSTPEKPLKKNSGKRKEYIYNEHSHAITGAVTTVFGSREDFTANYASILASFGIIDSFDEESQAEAAAAELKRVPEILPKNDRAYSNRIDLRSKVVFTIDSESAKDLDDAISVGTDENKNTVLGVHIADVSHYVTKRSALDVSAYERGTSVYFADRVVPMLPGGISNGICSLSENEDRLTVSVFMTFDKNGTLIKKTFHETIIRSFVKGIYKEINKIFSSLDEAKNGEKTPDAELAPLLEKYKKVLPTLKKARQLAKKLKKRRSEKGALELFTVESEFCISYDPETRAPIVDAVGRAAGGESEGMIEEFMIKANEAVAGFLEDRGYPCIYRVHEPPLAEKTEDFTVAIKKFGYNVSQLRKGSPSPAILQKVVEHFKGSDLSYTINTMLLRSLAKAVYSHENAGHFGLALEQYCHFTSPIRRYPDLVCHRILKSAANGETPEKLQKEYKGFIMKAAQHSSEREQNAVAAERKIEDLIKAAYMSTHIGEEFEGVINGVASFGMFVMLENTCEGLIRNTDIEGYIGADVQMFEIRTETGIYRLGQRIKIKVARASITDSAIDFVIVKSVTPG